MKICIIGNSHISALRWANRRKIFADRLPDIVFWGKPGVEFLEIKYEGGRLIAADPRWALYVSGGKYETIDPAEFDVLVFHGPPVNATDLLRSLRQYQAEVRCYSMGFLRDGIAQFLKGRPAIELIGQIRKSYKGRIIASPQPLISELSRHFGEQTGGPGERDRIERALSECFAQIDVEYLPQPPATIVLEQYTAAAFCVASTIASRKADFTHMNGVYGAEVWRRIAQELGMGAGPDDIVANRPGLASL